MDVLPTINYLSELSKLEQLLGQEFDMLSSRSFEGLSEVQKAKNEILLRFESNNETSEDCLEVLRENSDLVEKCRELQLKNQILVDKKLEAIQGVLDHLIAQGRKPSVHTYEHLRQ